MTAALLALASALLLWSPHRPAARRLRLLDTAHPQASPPDFWGTRLNRSGQSRDGPVPHRMRRTLAAARLVRLRLKPARRTGQAGPAPPGLAGAFDLLAACLVAGMPVPTAIRAVADQFPRHLAAVLRETADLLALGASPPDAWTMAVDCVELAQLARGARRSARSGTAMADLARGLARRAREQAADAAEARAQRAGVLIAGPLALCFLPAFLCLGIAPVVVGLASTFF